MLYLLNPEEPAEPFPDPATAETHPDGLLAVGGDLSASRLLNAYRNGIFPWYNEGEPILWWSPDPRMVLFPGELKISRSLGKTLRKGKFQVSMDCAFEQVISACAEPRGDGQGTWLSPEMIAAYHALHQQGYAHSVEAWQEGSLVGGLYGIALGNCFFGESMFSRRTDASKVAFVHLVEQLQQASFELIDCQVYTEHLERLGARMLPRMEFLDILHRNVDRPAGMARWVQQPKTTGKAER